MSNYPDRAVDEKRLVGQLSHTARAVGGKREGSNVPGRCCPEGSVAWCESVKMSRF